MRACLVKIWKQRPGCCVASALEAMGDMQRTVARVNHQSHSGFSASAAIEEIKDTCDDHYIEEIPCPAYIGMPRSGLIGLVLAGHCCLHCNPNIRVHLLLQEGLLL